MFYQEKNTDEGYEYKNEDLYGWTTIWSEKRLDADTLDQIVCEMVMEKKIKKGHTEGLRFEAKFKDQWLEDKEATELKTGWFINFKESLKHKLINLIKRI
jgi:hypothetical protein